MSKLKIGESERELLVFFARGDGRTVREAVEGVGRERGWARTTILKTVDRLLAKGLLIRDEVDGVFVYRSKHSEAEIQAKLIAQLIDGPLNGSIRPLMSFLDGVDEVSQADIEELRSLIRRLEERKP